MLLASTPAADANEWSSSPYEAASFLHRPRHLVHVSATPASLPGVAAPQWVAMTVRARREQATPRLRSGATSAGPESVQRRRRRHRYLCRTRVVWTSPPAGLEGAARRDMADDSYLVLHLGSGGWARLKGSSQRCLSTLRAGYDRVFVKWRPSPREGRCYLSRPNVPVIIFWRAVS